MSSPVARIQPAQLLAAEDGTPVVHVGDRPRELPRQRSISRDFKPFVDDVVRRQRVSREMRAYEEARCSRAEAARRPLAVIEPTRMSEVEPRSSGLYTPVHWPQMVPGRGRWPEGKHRLQEASMAAVLVPPTSMAVVSLDGEAEGGPTGEIRFDADGRVIWVEGARLTAARYAVEPSHLRHVLDPSGHAELETTATNALHSAGLIGAGLPQSSETRGRGRDRTAECGRRAIVHAHGLARSAEIHESGGEPPEDLDLDALRRPYQPQPGSSDALMSYRKAVAISLRLEGFSASTIARVLHRADANVERLVRGVAPMRAKPAAHGEADNWYRYRLGTDGLPVIDSDGHGVLLSDSAGAWRVMRREIAAAVGRGLRTPAGVCVLVETRERWFGRSVAVPKRVARGSDTGLSRPAYTPPRVRARRVAACGPRWRAPVKVAWDSIAVDRAMSAPSRVIDCPRVPVVVSETVERRLQVRLDALHRELFGPRFPAHDAHLRRPEKPCK